VANSALGGHGERNASAPAPTTYNDFVDTHPPLFTEAGEPLEADHKLRVIESKFGLLQCTEVHKTLFTTQQLRGNANAWWAIRRHLPRGLLGAMDRVPQRFLRPLHPSRHDEEEAPGVHGPKARWMVRARLLKAVQPSGIVHAGPGGHR
jgi:hypothetical protein